MKVVIDTNVLVSGLLKPLGASGQIVRGIADGQITLCFDASVLAEYEDVLGRPRFDFNPADVRDLLSQIQSGGVLVHAAPLAEPLPDRDDEIFLAVALAGGCRYLVTGNGRHFPAGKYGEVEIIPPAAFVSIIQKPK